MDSADHDPTEARLNEYNYANFMVYQTTKENENKLRSISDSLRQDKKDELRKAGVDPDKLDYNRYMMFYTPEYDYKQPNDLSEERYNKGKDSYQEFKVIFFD